MAGIAGLALAPSATAPDRAILSSLAKALAHRGPDGSGHTMVGRVALVHTQLAGVPADAGQPLVAGSAALVADAAISNDHELRQRLGETPLATSSDCEPPLHLWLRTGTAYAQSLRGMFAIAIHERVERSVTLTRDPFGIKPLYVAAVVGGVAFASEPQALLRAGLASRAVNPAARAEFLQLQFTTGAATLFAGIERVLPGESIRIADGHVVDRSRSAVLPEGGPEPIDEAAAVARLDRALMVSVERHLAGQVSANVLLSGGADAAALLVACARRRGVEATALAVGFEGHADAANRAAAEALAVSCGARLDWLPVSQRLLWQSLPAIVAAMDDPAADQAIIPAWFLARHASPGAKRVLSGEGAHELFGIYGRYRSAMRPWWQGGKVLRARGVFDKLDILRDQPATWRDGVAAAEARAALPGRTRLSVAQATDIADWLPHDRLLKLDRCLMAHGIEPRPPFLDAEMLAASFRLPDALKIRAGEGGYLLRRWLATALPRAELRPASVPIGPAIASAGATLGPLVARSPGVEEFARPGRVEALFRQIDDKRARQAAWTLLFYALWHRAHIQALPVDGDVFDVLAA